MYNNFLDLGLQLSHVVTCTLHVVKFKFCTERKFGNSSCIQRENNTYFTWRGEDTVSAIGLFQIWKQTKSSTVCALFAAF